MKNNQDNRNSFVVLTDPQIKFFYNILVYCENKQFNRTGYNKRRFEKIFYGTCKTNVNWDYPTGKRSKENINFNKSVGINEIRIIFSNNIGGSFLYYLRCAFAHNNIRYYGETKDILLIENTYNDKIRMKAKIKFSVLKKLVDAIQKSKE